MFTIRQANSLTYTCCCYDHNPRDIADWIRTGGDTNGISGAMYTTWQDEFSQLETFAEAAWGE